MYAYDRDVEAVQAAIAALGERISRITIYSRRDAIHGWVTRFDFHSDEEALNALYATGLLVDMTALPTHQFVGGIPFRAIEGPGRLWLSEHGVTIVERAYVPDTFDTVLASFIIEAPSVQVLEDAKRYIEDRIVEVSQR